MAITAFDPDQARRRELLRAVSGLGFILSAGFVVWFALAGAWLSALCTVVVGLTYLATIATARRAGPAFTITASIGFLFTVGSMGIAARETGGLASPLFLWFNLPPMMAYFALGLRGGSIVFAGAALIATLVMLMPASVRLEATATEQIRFAAPFLVLATTFGLTFWMERAWRVSFDELRVANAALAAARDDAQRASRAKSEFVATVSHELRTPLSAIMATTDLLLSSSLGAGEHENVRVARDAAGALTVLVDDLLDLSCLDADRLELRPAPTDVAAVARSAVELLAQRAADKGIALAVEAPEGTPRLVLDGHRLRQIVTILIDNAVKFTHAGRVQVSVRATVLATDAALEVTVTDTGIGVSADMSNAIFERFRQGDSSPTRRYGGAGLGLSIARDLAHLMGGDVRLVASGAATGATFRLGLVAPLAQVDVLPAGLAGRRILVAEDNPVNQRLAVMLLQSAGAIVDVASDGAEAVRLAAAVSYDLVLMDLYMPQMDGFRAAEAMRASGSRMPIVALTAAGTDDDVARARAVGMNGVLKKPVDVDAIRRALEDALVPA